MKNFIEAIVEAEKHSTKKEKFEALTGLDDIRTETGSLCVESVYSVWC